MILNSQAELDIYDEKQIPMDMVFQDMNSSLSIQK